jgi:hypothetical protein
LPISVRPNNDEEARTASRLKTAVDVLARVCVRDTDEGRDLLWDFACAVYKNPAIRAGVGFDKLVRNLFVNLRDSSTTLQLSQRLPALFRLPIGGEDDFPVFYRDSWPDPAVMTAERLVRPIANNRLAQWRDITRRLFVLVGSSDEILKKAAFYRLGKLYDLGALSASEGKRLGKLFWAPPSEPSSLPIAAWGRNAPHWALTLPEPRGVAAAEKVKSFILAAQLGEVHGGIIWPDWLLDLMLYATKPLDNRLRNRHHYVLWTVAEVRRLFGLIQAWWERYGQQKAEEVRTTSWRRAFDGSAFRQFVNTLWDVVRIVIIPHMGRHQATKAKVTALIEAMRSAGVPVGAVLPATLLLEPESLDRVASHLREELANPEPEFYLSALRGIFYWVELSKGERGGLDRTILPSVPADLLREVSMAVALRRPESLDLSLDFAYNVIRRLEGSPDQQFVNNLIRGLNYLFDETQYQATAPASSRYAYSEIPHLRLLAARLAKCLSDMGFGANDVIRKWCEVAVADPLPEVRHVMTEPESHLNE